MNLSEWKLYRLPVGQDSSKGFFFKRGGDSFVFDSSRARNKMVADLGKPQARVTTMIRGYKSLLFRKSNEEIQPQAGCSDYRMEENGADKLDFFLHFTTNLFSEKSFLLAARNSGGLLKIIFSQFTPLYFIQLSVHVKGIYKALADITQTIFCYNSFPRLTQKAHFNLSLTHLRASAQILKCCYTLLQLNKLLGPSFQYWVAASSQSPSKSS